MRLSAVGWQVANRTVLKLVRELKLACWLCRKRGYTSYRGRVRSVADNVLDRDFTATGLQKWSPTCPSFASASPPFTSHQ